MAWPRAAVSDNAVVLDEFRVLNADGLRYGDEFVAQAQGARCNRRPLPLGYPLLAHFEAHKSGHALNNQLARAPLDAKDAWELVKELRRGGHGAARRFTLAGGQRRRLSALPCSSSACFAVIVVIAVAGGVVVPADPQPEIPALFLACLPLFADRCAARFALMVSRARCRHSPLSERFNSCSIASRRGDRACLRPVGPRFRRAPSGSGRSSGLLDWCDPSRACTLR